MSEVPAHGAGILVRMRGRLVPIVAFRPSPRAQSINSHGFSFYCHRLRFLAVHSPSCLPTSWTCCPRSSSAPFRAALFAPSTS